jgi:hypothetical protein
MPWMVAGPRPRHPATGRGRSCARRVFSAPSRGIAVLILPGGPLRFQIGEVTGVSTCRAGVSAYGASVSAYDVRVSAYGFSIDGLIARVRA